MITLRFHTGRDWLDAVLADFDAFLLDHAAAEKKASGMAVSMLSHYPDKPDLVKAMIDLSIEEMTHFRDVVRLLQQRGIPLTADAKDPYINEFRSHIRNGKEEYFLDRLLSGGIIEARGNERFGLVAEGVEDPALKRFYTAICQSESRHADQFVNLAELYFPQDVVSARLHELLDIEAEIARKLPIRAALH